MSTPDFIDMLDALRAHDVRFLIVGGYAVGFHGHPRATKDLDVWVEPSAENAPRRLRAWPHPLEAAFFQRPACPIIGRDDLIRNKRASARLQDLADVEALEALAAAT